LAGQATELIKLSSQIALMQSVVITSGPPDLMQADVLFATATEFERTPPMCDLLVIEAPISPSALSKVTRYMPEGGKVVIYG
jgi:hypothetical protein